MAHFPGSQWTFITPASGATVAIPSTDQTVPRNVIIKVPTLLAALTVQFPTALDGQSIRLRVTGVITVVTMTCASGDTVDGPYAVAAATTRGIWTYSATDLTWYRWTN